jgi:WD40 repeat protein
MEVSLASALHVGTRCGSALTASFVLWACAQYDETSSDAPDPQVDPSEPSETEPQPAANPSPAPTLPDDSSTALAESAKSSWTDCGRLETPGADSSGPPDSGIRDLSISADGGLLLSNGPGTMAWQVARVFSESAVLWTTVGSPENGNVAVSADGRFASVSGDIRALYDARSGDQLRLPSHNDAPIDDEMLCLNTEFEFSPDGRWIAGKQYATRVDVFDTEALELVTWLATPSCGQGISFSPDGKSLATPEGIYSTATWTVETSLVPVPTGWQPYLPDLIEYSADGHHLLRTSCRDEVCHSLLDEMPLSRLDSPIRQRHLSPSGSWVVAGPALLHWPSDTVVTLPDAISAAIFAPNSDVIAGLEDGNLVRYCRSPEAGGVDTE